MTSSHLIRNCAFHKLMFIGILSMRYILHCTYLFLLVALSASAAPASPGIGVWSLRMDTPQGVQEAVLTIANDGTGKFGGARGEQAISELELNNNLVEFSIDINAQGQAIKLLFRVAVDGDTLSGSMRTPAGDIPVSGTRR